MKTKYTDPKPRNPCGGGKRNKFSTDSNTECPSDEEFHKGSPGDGTEPTEPLSVPTAAAFEKEVRKEVAMNTKYTDPKPRNPCGGGKRNKFSIDSDTESPSDEESHKGSPGDGTEPTEPLSVPTGAAFKKEVQQDESVEATKTSTGIDKDSATVVGLGADAATAPPHVSRDNSEYNDPPEMKRMTVAKWFPDESGNASDERPRLLTREDFNECVILPLEQDDQPLDVRLLEDWNEDFYLLEARPCKNHNDREAQEKFWISLRSKAESYVRWKIERIKLKWMLQDGKSLQLELDLPIHEPLDIYCYEFTDRKGPPGDRKGPPGIWINFAKPGKGLAKALGSSAALKHGSTLLSVDGVEVRDTDKVKDLLTEAKARPGTTNVSVKLCLSKHANLTEISHSKLFKSFRLCRLDGQPIDPSSYQIPQDPEAKATSKLSPSLPAKSSMSAPTDKGRDNNKENADEENLLLSRAPPAFKNQREANPPAKSLDTKMAGKSGIGYRDEKDQEEDAQNRSSSTSKKRVRGGPSPNPPPEPKKIRGSPGVEIDKKNMAHNLSSSASKENIQPILQQQQQQQQQQAPHEGRQKPLYLLKGNKEIRNNRNITIESIVRKLSETKEVVKKARENTAQSIEQIGIITDREITTTVEKLRKEKNEARLKVCALEEKCKILEEKCKDLEEKCKDLEKDQDHEISDLENKLKQAENSNKTLKKELEEAKTSARDGAAADLKSGMHEIMEKVASTVHFHTYGTSLRDDKDNEDGMLTLDVLDRIKSHTHGAQTPIELRKETSRQVSKTTHCSATIEKEQSSAFTDKIETTVADQLLLAGKKQTLLTDTDKHGSWDDHSFDVGFDGYDDDDEEEAPEYSTSISNDEHGREGVSGTNNEIRYEGGSHGGSRNDDSSTTPLKKCVLGGPPPNPPPQAKKVRESPGVEVDEEDKACRDLEKKGKQAKDSNEELEGDTTSIQHRTKEFLQARMSNQQDVVSNCNDKDLRDEETNGGDDNQFNSPYETLKKELEILKKELEESKNSNETLKKELEEAKASAQDGDNDVSTNDGDIYVSMNESNEDEDEDDQNLSSSVETLPFHPRQGNMTPLPFKLRPENHDDLFCISCEQEFDQEDKTQTGKKKTGKKKAKVRAPPGATRLCSLKGKTPAITNYRKLLQDHCKKPSECQLWQAYAASNRRFGKDKSPERYAAYRMNTRLNKDESLWLRYDDLLSTDSLKSKLKAREEDFTAFCEKRDANHKVLQLQGEDKWNVVDESIVIVETLIGEIVSIIEHPNFENGLCPHYTKEKFINDLNVAMTLKGKSASIFEQMNKHLLAHSPQTNIAASCKEYNDPPERTEMKQMAVLK